MGAVLFLGGLSIVLGVMAWRRSPTLLRGALRNALLRFIEVLPRIAFAFLAAGFISKLAPWATFPFLSPLGPSPPHSSGT